MQAAQPADGDVAAAPAAVPSLTVELVGRIFENLPGNEAACSLRTLCKATASTFSDMRYRTIRLSQPTPPEPFRQRWGSPNAMRSLTRGERIELIQLTTISGNVENLAVVLDNVGLAASTCIAFDKALRSGLLDVCVWLRKQPECPVPDTDLLNMAAELSGSVELCQWMQEQGAEAEGETLMYAAKGGHRSLCELLLGQGYRTDGRAATAAVHHGRVDLALWLIARDPLHDRNLCRLMVEAAQYCDLAGLQRLHGALIAGREARLGGLWRAYKTYVLQCAVRSPLPDWREKVEWLQANGFEYGAGTEGAAFEFEEISAEEARQPDIVERVRWLKARDVPVLARRNAVALAAESGACELLRYLLDEQGRRADDFEAAVAAASQGHLPVLQLLHARGCRVACIAVLHAAARGGHLPVVRWILEELPAAERSGLQLDEELAYSCAVSMEQLAWVRERGCPWDGRVHGVAVAMGWSEEALEGLVAQGCPLESNGDPYIMASKTRDLAALRCLHRLGFPWGPPGRVLEAASAALMARPAELGPVQDCLLKLGCPIWQGRGRGMGPMGMGVPMGLGSMGLGSARRGPDAMGPMGMGPMGMGMGPMGMGMGPMGMGPGEAWDAEELMAAMQQFMGRGQWQ